MALHLEETCDSTFTVHTILPLLILQPRRILKISSILTVLFRKLSLCTLCVIFEGKFQIACALIIVQKTYYRGAIVLKLTFKHYTCGNKIIQLLDQNFLFARNGAVHPVRKIRNMILVHLVMVP